MAVIDFILFIYYKKGLMDGWMDGWMDYSMRAHATLGVGVI